MGILTCVRPPLIHLPLGACPPCMDLWIITAVKSSSHLLFHALYSWFRVYYFRNLLLQVLVVIFFSLSLAFMLDFYSAVLQQFGPRVGRLTLAFLLFSAGMFQASTSFLPSSFSMQVFLIILITAPIDAKLKLQVHVPRFDGRMAQSAPRSCHLYYRIVHLFKLAFCRYLGVCVHHATSEAREL